MRISDWSSDVCSSDLSPRSCACCGLPHICSWCRLPCCRPSSSSEAMPSFAAAFAAPVPSYPDRERRRPTKGDGGNLPCGETGSIPSVPISRHLSAAIAAQESDVRTHPPLLACPHHDLRKNVN